MKEEEKELKAINKKMNKKYHIFFQNKNFPNYICLPNKSQKYFIYLIKKDILNFEISRNKIFQLIKVQFSYFISTSSVDVLKIPFLLIIISYNLSKISIFNMILYKNII